MIHGTVVGLQARMEIFLRPSGASLFGVECVIDTGFEGFLTLPQTVVTDLNLPFLAPIRANLADNSRISTNVYLATIVWNGRDREVPVLAMGRRPLIGTALLQDYHLGIDFYEGGTVLVDDIL